MIAVRQEMWIPMGRFVSGGVQLGHLRRLASGRGDSEQRSVRSRVQNRPIARPRAPTRDAPDVSQALRRRAEYIDLLQFAVGEEPDESRVRRPERIEAAFGALYDGPCDTLEGPDPQLADAMLDDARCETAPIE